MSGWRKILCPVDFTEPSHAAMTEALMIAAKAEGLVHLLHVIELQPGTHRGEGMSAAGSQQALAGQARIALAEWRREAEALLPGGVTDEVAPGGGGAPADQVTRVAREAGFDLVVMGTHGRRGFRRLVLGSVAEAVVRGAPCSVLVVRPRGHEG
jgi:nucleotide-binding universal stress UspA family protein